ncbi:MAG: MFS transporter [Oleiphilus sp.]
MTQRPVPFASFTLVISALYLSQGLPGGLIAHALPAFLREQGSSLAFIAALKLLALPWLFKFLWAPLVERSASYSERFRWIFRMQILTTLGLLVLSWSISSSSYAAICLGIALLLLVNLASATQDIATDGLTASSTPKKYLGLVNSIQVSAYKVGMLIGGSGLLLLTPYFDIPTLIRLLSLVILFLLAPLVYLKRHFLLAEQAAQIDKPVQQTDANYESNGILSTLLTSYRGYFSQGNIMPWLGVLLTYKIADSLGSTLFKPMLIDLGISLNDIGFMTIYATIAGLVGAVLAGGFYRFLGMKFCLICFGVLQTISVSSLYVVNVLPFSLTEIYALAMVEQFCDGLSTVTLFAVMMKHCRKGHEGADYTLQASIQIALAGIVGASSGVLASIGGFSLLYASCLLFGVFSLFLALRYIKHLPDSSA